MRLIRHLAGLGPRSRPVSIIASGLIAAASSVALAVPAVAAPLQPSACRPVLTGLSVPELAYAGDKVSGTVSLSCAPSRSTTVLLRSDQSRLTTPSTVVVPPGQTSATVPLTAQPAEGPQYRARVTARYNGRQASDEITVNPGLKSVSITPRSDPNGVSLSVLLTGPAPDGGLTAQLASDNPAVTMPPAADFQVGSTGVHLSAWQVLPVTEETEVTLSATLGTRTLTASKVLIPPSTGEDLSLRAPEGDLYGLEHFLQFDVVLASPAPVGGFQVQLGVRDANPAIRLDSTSVHISEGSTSAGFFLGTADVTRTTHVVLEAAIGTTTATLPVTIHPRITEVAVPESVRGGTSFQGMVTLAGPSEVDTTVFLQPGCGIVEIVDPTLVIPAGATSATFTATTSTVDEPSPLFITAYLGRTQTQSSFVTITP